MKTAENLYISLKKRKQIGRALTVNVVYVNMYTEVSFILC